MQPQEPADHVPPEAGSERDWLSRLRNRSVSLPEDVDPEAAVSAVMSVFIGRLTAGEVHQLFAALPESVGALFGQREARRERGGPVDKFDRAEFLMRVAGELGVTPAHAEAIATDVLAMIRAELPPRIADGVAAQLPHDLKSLWLSSGIVAPPPVPASERGMRHWVEEEIRRRVSRDLVHPEAALCAVLGIFLQRISGGEAWDVLMGLPEELQPLLESAALDRAEPARVFGRDEFLAAVATRLSIPKDESEGVVRAVFAAIRGVLPVKEVDDVSSELPGELRDLWLSSS
jgi:uncharacterized protein (DUF2267 family)